MTETRRVAAAVLIIGNEILSGRTKDANLAYLGLELNKLGIQLREARVVADIESEIIEALTALRVEVTQCVRAADSQNPPRRGAPGICGRKARCWLGHLPANRVEITTHRRISLAAATAASRAAALL
ncbi:MAG: hypothetical protein EBS20_06205 [Actinobacteria bacterium]|nr:hypothetical protein [Actinomycetota bacterium]